MAQGLSGVCCSRACGIFPDQGLNLCLVALTAEFLTTAPPGKSSPCLLYVCMCLCLCVCVSVHVCVWGCIEEKGSVCPCSVWSQMLWKGLALPSQPGPFMSERHSTPLLDFLHPCNRPVTTGKRRKIQPPDALFSTSSLNKAACLLGLLASSGFL